MNFNRHNTSESYIYTYIYIYIYIIQLFSRRPSCTHTPEVMSSIRLLAVTHRHTRPCCLMTIWRTSCRRLRQHPYRRTPYTRYRSQFMAGGFWTELHAYLSHRWIFWSRFQCIQWLASWILCIFVLKHGEGEAVPNWSIRLRRCCVYSQLWKAYNRNAATAIVGLIQLLTSHAAVRDVLGWLYSVTDGII